MVLLACEKAIKKIVDESPKAGLVVDKNEDTESRIRYGQVLIGIKRLNNHFAHIGAHSMGICDTCTHFSRAGVSSVADSFGKCTNPKGKRADLIHCYDSCNNHSVEGGGYGKV